jgi:hypothetical protein
MAKSKAQQALEFFREQAKRCETERDLHNAFFGIGGKVGQLFPTRAERETFWLTPEFAEIDRIRDSFDSKPTRAKSRKS